MLRKRTRSMQKDQQTGHSTMSDSDSDSRLQFGCPGQSCKTNTFLSGPGLFVGLSPKGLSDCDSIRSPTSPLDLRKAFRSPALPHNGRLKSWDCSKVGLGIVDSLDDDTEFSSRILQSSESRSILFRAQVRITTPDVQSYSNSFQAPRSLPKNFAILCRNHAKSPVGKGNSDVVFEIGDAPSETESFGRTRSCSLDFCRSVSRLSHSGNSQKSSWNFYPNHVSNQVKSPLQPIGGGLDSNNSLSRNVSLTAMSPGSVNELIGSLSASEIETSEDYTCVISHGPNPKKTHIYGDCILKCHPNYLGNFDKNEVKEIALPQAVTGSMFLSSFPSNDFLSFCYYCNKWLEGKDIYIYRGEKAFCSVDCRLQEIMIVEELEKNSDMPMGASPKSQSGEQLF
uniref:FLZ-type domain-containing protein n=1 Tax=Rhizophora mucronata TaxID=61149 RepID=A0A2P2JMD5_RHIMU